MGKHSEEKKKRKVEVEENVEEDLPEKKKKKKKTNSVEDDASGVVQEKKKKKKKEEEEEMRSQQIENEDKELDETTMKQKKEKKEKKEKKQKKEKKEASSSVAETSSEATAIKASKTVTVTNCESAPEPLKAFEDVKLPKKVKKVIDEKGFTTPTPIQSYAIPLVLSGRDVVAIAETGSGKTLAFALPGIAKLFKRDERSKAYTPGMLVLAPTRELAIQINEVIVGVAVGLSSVCIFGGDPKGPQIRALKAGVDIVVCTPGRLVDLIGDNCCNLSEVCLAVLDEADRMLDMGFEPVIRKILAETPDDRQTIMFSATWPKDVRKLAGDFLKDAAQVTVGSDKLASNVKVVQSVRVCEDWEKKKLLTKQLTEWCGGHGKLTKNRILIFALYKKSCQRLADDLWRDGWHCAVIHGDKSQNDRNEAVRQFKAGEVNILVATDVAARGLDIKNVEYVLNYEFPLLCEDYVHRVGRTGRAGTTGVAVTYFTKENNSFARELRSLLQQAGMKIDPEFDALADKAPAQLPRRSAASKLYGEGRGFGADDDKPMPKAIKITFDD